MPTAPPVDLYALARRSAVPALLLVTAEAAVAVLFSLVPALRAAHPASAPWVAVAAPLFIAAAALAVLLARRGPLALVAALVGAAALGAAAAGLGALSPSLRGIGLAFAVPLVAGEVLAAGAWLASRTGGERASAALSLGGACAVTCAAAFFGERLDVEMTALAAGVGGVLAQLQLAAARVGEARAALAGPDVVTVAVARFAGVPRVLLLAAVGRSGPQEDA